MKYDLFVSYSRRDNEEGRVTQFVGRIQSDFRAFSGRPLRVFFDVSEIHGMEDWRHRILTGLREAQLLLSFFSPAYFASPYCEWEFNEYLKSELNLGYFGDGIAPVYFVEVPGWHDQAFEKAQAGWIAELRRRQHFDLRPWFAQGEDALRDAAVRGRMSELKSQLANRIIRQERAEQSVGNVARHNVHFVGRVGELRRLREVAALGRVGVLTAVQGLGGIGKTALAVEYAHAFAHEYGGGRWQVRCEGEEHLDKALAQLAAPLGLPAAENAFDASQRVLAELRRRCQDAAPAPRCLLLLDNVDRSSLLSPQQVQILPAEDWLHVIATTRLAPGDMHNERADRAFISVGELGPGDGLALIEGYQPSGKFASEAERNAAREIVTLIGGVTLALENAALDMGRHGVSCEDYLGRLRNEFLPAGSSVAPSSEAAVAATLAPTWRRLAEEEREALTFAAMMPADYVRLEWLRELLARDHPDIGRDAEPGYPDPWRMLQRRLFEMRLLQQVPGGVARMHRLLQHAIRQSVDAKVLAAAKARVNRQFAIVTAELQMKVEEASQNRRLQVSTEQAQLEDELQVHLNMIRERRVWHPAEPEVYKELGALQDYATVYRFPCCGKLVVADVWPPSQWRADGCRPAPPLESKESD